MQANNQGFEPACAVLRRWIGICSQTGASPFVTGVWVGPCLRKAGALHHGTCILESTGFDPESDILDLFSKYPPCAPSL
eukprot:839395-Pelagomonas_calceolata.AAC.5